MEDYKKWVYYAPYDISVNSETGKIPLPICKCKEDDSCIFMRNWISDGRPTHIPKGELEKIVSKESNGGDFVI